jgi:hypothetical protein
MVDLHGKTECFISSLKILDADAMVNRRAAVMTSNNEILIQSYALARYEISCPSLILTVDITVTCKKLPCIYGGNQGHIAYVWICTIHLGHFTTCVGLVWSSAMIHDL